MLYAVTGRPGEGKSCFAVQHLIINELENGTRPIYTNIWLHRGKINHYLKKKGIKADMKRLHYLEEDQIRRFWTYGEKNALMVLDEVGEFFNANAWKELSKDPEWDPASYARLHRKVGHETYLIVQDLAHIYKQYRDLISFHIQLVNCYYRKILGFNGPRIFLAKTFDQLSPHKAIESRVYKYNMKVFNLYDTSQIYEVNSGVKTQDAKTYKETEYKEKGKVSRFISKVWTWLSRRFFFVVIVVVAVVIFFVFFRAPSYFMSLSDDYLRPNKSKETKPKEVTIIEDDQEIKNPIVVNDVQYKPRPRAKRDSTLPTIRHDTVDKRVP